MSSSSARELAEINPGGKSGPVDGRGVAITRGAVREERGLTKGPRLERVENITLLAFGARSCISGHGKRAIAWDAGAPRVQWPGGFLKKVVVGREAEGACERARGGRF